MTLLLSLCRHQYAIDGHPLRLISAYTLQLYCLHHHHSSSVLQLIATLMIRITGNESFLSSATSWTVKSMFRVRHTKDRGCPSKAACVHQSKRSTGALRNGAVTKRSVLYLYKLMGSTRNGVIAIFYRLND